MSLNNLSPFIGVPLDQRRQSSVLSELETSLLPHPFIKQQKILPPIARAKTPRFEPNLGQDAGIKGVSLAENSENELKMPLKAPALLLRKTEKDVTTRSRHFVSTPSPLLSPIIKNQVAQKFGNSNIVAKVRPALRHQHRRPGGDLSDVLSSSDGAKQLAAEKKRLKTIKSKLTRKLSYQSTDTAGLLSRDRGIRRGSDAVFSTTSMEFVTSSGIGSTMRLCDSRSQATSTSTTFTESLGPNEGFLPLRRRKSSNALLVPDFDVEIISTRRSSVRRRSSVTSISFPDVTRDARLSPNSRTNVIHEPHFIKIRQPRSRRTSSTSDEAGRIAEEMPRNSSSPFQPETSHNKSPNMGFSQLHRRLKVSYLSQQFIREMKGRRRRKRKTSSFSEPPIEKFRKVARSVRLLLRCLTDYRMVATVSEKGEMPFAMFSTNLTSVRKYPGGLSFDPEDYKATTERQVSPELRRIMTLAPSLRTDKELNFALKNLRVLAEAFGEFPIRMQESLVRVTWLDEFEAKRVIIRQGQPAENFYFIVTGSVLVSKNRIDPRTGELFVQTVNILRSGMSFGELAIMRRETRSANVISNSSLALLTVAREDFIDIFMHRMDGEEPEFISFLRKRPEFALFPLQQIPRNKPEICAFTYFRVGVVICDETSANDTIVVVKSGFCKVMKAMKAVKADLRSLKTGKFVFKTTLLTGDRRTASDESDLHCRYINESYNDWIASHPLSLETLKFLADDEETIKREGRRRRSLIEVERDIDHNKLLKEMEPPLSPFKLPAEIDSDHSSEETVYIHVQTLGEGDVFGLAPLLFEPSEGGVHMSLVSEGAECILLNKNFYLKNVDAEIRETLIRTVQPYPTVETMEENMKKKCNWDAFKHKTMQEYFSNRKACEALKHNGFQRYR